MPIHHHKELEQMLKILGVKIKEKEKKMKFPGAICMTTWGHDSMKQLETIKEKVVKLIDPVQPLQNNNNNNTFF